jgi:hypothetical protein
VRLFLNRNGSVVALKIDGKVTQRSRSCGLPEGAVFSADSRYFVHRQLHRPGHQHLRVEGDQLVDTVSLSCLVNQRRCGKDDALTSHIDFLRGSP